MKNSDATGGEARGGGGLGEGEVALRTTCRRGHAKEPGGHCKECARLTYKRRAAARRAEGLTARGRPRYSLRTHCPHGHLRSENEVRRKTSRYSYCLARTGWPRSRSASGEASGRAAGAVFHNSHLTYKLPSANPAKKDGLAIEHPEISAAPLRRRETQSVVSPSLKRIFPSESLQVVAGLSINNGGETRRGQTGAGLHVNGQELHRRGVASISS